jgi:hypothetical protein
VPFFVELAKGRSFVFYDLRATQSDKHCRAGWSAASAPDRGLGDYVPQYSRNHYITVVKRESGGVGSAWGNSTEAMLADADSTLSFPSPR